MKREVHAFSDKEFEALELGMERDDMSGGRLMSIVAKNSDVWHHVLERAATLKSMANDSIDVLGELLAETEMSMSMSMS